MESSNSCWDSSWSILTVGLADDTTLAQVFVLDEGMVLTSFRMVGGFASVGLRADISWRRLRYLILSVHLE